MPAKKYLVAQSLENRFLCFCFSHFAPGPAATAGAPKALPLDTRVRRARGTGTGSLLFPIFPAPAPRAPPRDGRRRASACGPVEASAPCAHAPGMTPALAAAPSASQLRGSPPARLEPLAPHAGTSAGFPEMSSTISTLR